MRPSIVRVNSGGGGGAAPRVFRLEILVSATSITMSGFEVITRISGGMVAGDIQKLSSLADQPIPCS